MPKQGTKGRNVWGLLEDVYRKQLAKIEITHLGNLGIMSSTNYYQLRADQMLPRYDIACYLGLCFYAAFLNRDPAQDTPTQAQYRRWKSWDVVLELTHAFAMDFAKRCGNENYPTDPSVRLSAKFRQQMSDRISHTLIDHDMAGSGKPGLLLQHAVSSRIKFGDQ